MVLCAKDNLIIFCNYQTMYIYITFRYICQCGFLTNCDQVILYSYKTDCQYIQCQ